ncbi:GDSL esterase/lipase [Acorus calamus]|uniref:GDSL esterase/lipase n=1 Tax=Acorus calamus TaxID=4465 RepID=A0AAV9DCY7_ACOCL|nr:GDSL esterase/lipase [Acorus calamus]
MLQVITTPPSPLPEESIAAAAAREDSGRSYAQRGSSSISSFYAPNHHNPADSGFFEGRKACCGTGTIETSLLCNPHSPGTCANATGFVFWDSVHPSEAANNLLAAQEVGSQGRWPKQVLVVEDGGRSRREGCSMETMCVPLPQEAMQPPPPPPPQFPQPLPPSPLKRGRGHPPKQKPTRLPPTVPPNQVIAAPGTILEGPPSMGSSIQKRPLDALPSTKGGFFGGGSTPCV